MNKIEKEVLRDKYNKYKEIYISLKKELRSVPKDSVEYYEILGEISGIKIGMASIRKSLFNEPFRKFYLRCLLFNDDIKEKGGR